MSVAPEHMSYSSLARYEECPRSYYLGKVKHAEEKQTWLGSSLSVPQYTRWWKSTSRLMTKGQATF